jgi:hypothetical protein
MMHGGIICFRNQGRGGTAFSGRDIAGSGEPEVSEDLC